MWSSPKRACEHNTILLALHVVLSVTVHGEGWEVRTTTTRSTLGVPKDAIDLQ